jgi:hypothetical protein
MRRPIFDRHLDAALAFAESHTPCLVVVDTLPAYDKAIIRLSQFGQVFRMSGSMSSVARIASIRMFDDVRESTGKKFLVAMRHMLVNSGLRLSHPAYIASSGVLTARDAQQLQSLTALIKGRFTEHLIHMKPTRSLG